MKKELAIISISLLIGSTSVAKDLYDSTVYAYTSSAGETDQTPCITADGTNACKSKELIVANNCLKFGSKVKIFDKVYTVHDRMNKRYGCKVFDIFMKKKSDAIKFGKKRTTVIVLK